MHVVTRTPFATPDTPRPANDNSLANAVRQAFDPRCETTLPVRRDRKIFGKIAVVAIAFVAAEAGLFGSVAVANLIDWLF
jgi:hypothetical protein